MMKKTIIYHITLIMLLVVTLGACTHNNGDIGNWFGTWQVESITADGVQVTTDGDYFFQFQSTVFRVSQVKEHEQMVESYGKWDDSESGVMTVTFPDPSVFYINMPGLENENRFAITKQSSKELTLTKTSTTGIVYNYKLKKQP